MARISRGFATTSAVFGVLLLLFGAGSSIVSWTMSGQIASMVIDTSSYSSSGHTIGNYWWGGLGFLLPGILGIVTGCTRNVCVMVFFLVVNLICMMASLGASVLIALVLTFWSILDNANASGKCQYYTPFFPSQTEYCKCETSAGTIKIQGVTCDIIPNLETYLGAVAAVTILVAIFSFIASYISCCALCNQEPDEAPMTIITQQGGSYQPPPMVISNTTNIVPQPQHGGFQQQPNYGGGQAYPPQGGGYQQVGYVPQQSAYPPQQSGYPQQQDARYPEPHAGYNVHTDAPPAYAPQQDDKANLIYNEHGPSM